MIAEIQAKMYDSMSSAPKQATSTGQTYWSARKPVI